MRLFIIKVSIFIFTTLLFFELICSCKIFTGSYKNNVAGSETYYSIQKSKKLNSKARILVMGDSVANQLFENKCFNGDINSLTCNKAVGVIGQFLLLNNYINAGNKNFSLYLIYNPLSFECNLDSEFTFHYFLKPFGHKEYYHYFNKKVKEQLNKIPFYYLYFIPHILTGNWAPSYKSKKSENSSILSPISANYLKRIIDLSIKNNINFVMLPTPVAVKNKTRIDNFNINTIKNNSLKKIFSKYLDDIIYLDNSRFVDGVHLEEPVKFVKYYKKKFRQASLTDMSL